MLHYRSLAESWRVLTSYRLRSRGEIVANNIRAQMDDAWTIISFFYPKDGIGNRLSDEDFREIFFLLTDAYPEEVDENPDPIHLLTTLSETDLTVGSAKSVVDRAHRILEAPDNEVRAWLIRPLFERISKRDLHPFFMRLSVRASPIRRRDVILALSMAYEHPFHHIRTSVNLLGLQSTVRDLSLGAFDYSKIRPVSGKPIILPSPVLLASPDAIGFTKCFVEIVEGTRITVHHSKTGTIGFSASGSEIPDDDGWMSRWAEALKTKEFPMDYGIYLCDYAEQRDNPLLLVDWLTPDNPKTSFNARRKVLSSVPDWALKPLQLYDSPAMISQDEYDLPLIIHNARGILTYENTIEEIALLNPKTRERVVRVLSGRVVESSSGGSPIVMWRLGVRDGFDYYPVTEVECELDFKRYCAPYKVIIGEAVKIETPLFVTVNVLASGWGDIGAYLNCRIVEVAPAAGISDCIGVEELGYVDTESR